MLRMLAERPSLRHVSVDLLAPELVEEVRAAAAVARRANPALKVSVCTRRDHQYCREEL